jgi:hypothetical protein
MPMCEAQSQFEESDSSHSTSNIPSSPFRRAESTHRVTRFQSYLAVLHNEQLVGGRDPGPHQLVMVQRLVPLALRLELVGHLQPGADLVAADHGGTPGVQLLLIQNAHLQTDCTDGA